MPRDVPAPEPPTTLLEVDLGDSELVVREHPDGMFTLDMPEPRLVAGPEHFEQIVRGFDAIARAKGWT